MNWGVFLGAFAGSLIELVEILAVVLVAFAFLLRGALQRVPVKPTKFFAAVLLIGFGAYGFGEGIGVEWPGGVLSVVGLVVLAGAAMAAGAAVSRSRSKSEGKAVR